MFRSVRVDRRRSSTTVVILIALSFVVVGWMWFVCRSGFWDATNIDIQGLRTMGRGEVLQEIDHFYASRRGWRPWKPSNVVFLDTKALEASLRERLFAENVIVDKSYPNVLRLLITERQRSVVLVSGEQYVTVDMNGVVTGDATGDVLASSRERIEARAFADQIHLPVVVMPTADPLTTGFQVATPDEVARWIDTSRSFVLNGVNVRFMKTESPGASLNRFVSERGYDIYVDNTQPIEPQIETYLTYLRTKPDESQITAYIDIRVAGRVYIK